jgi:hypothetical protein
MLQQSVTAPETALEVVPRARRVVDAVSVVAVVAPFVVAVVAVLAGRGVVWGGDQALLALDTWHVRQFDQPLGAYSRTGWAHPGPAWLVLLAPFYWAFGSDGAALVAASLAVHALAAALVVVLAGTGRAWQRPLMAVVVLVYVLRMPAMEFVGVWNPYAALLPTMLLLLLASRACAGSAGALAGCLVVGSFLVQTHIGTAPLVVLVGLVAAGVFAVRMRRDPAARPDGRGRIRALLLAGAAVLMWIPPLWQQLTAPDSGGNLGLLLDYFLHGDPAAEGGSHTWREAVSATGQMLGSPVFGWQPSPAPIDVGILTPAVAVGLLATLLGAVGVTVLGRPVPGRQASWLGAVTAVATVAALLAARTVTGPVHNYLLAWVTVLPPVLLFAGISVVIERWDRRGALSGRTGPAAVGVVAVILAVAAATSLHRATGDLSDQPGAAEASRLALDALPDPEDASPVLLDIRDVDVWTTATTVALELEQAGYRVVVEEEWVYGFGSDRAAEGDEPWQVLLVPVAGPDAPARPGQVGVVGTAGGPAAVLVRPAA